MKALLKTLAEHGEISYLSFYFAEFIAEQSNADMDSLLCYSAALVSENNQRGDVCIELELYFQLPLFNSDRIDIQSMPAGIDAAQWQQVLLKSCCVTIAGNEAPLVLDQGRLYLNRYWFFESSVSENITARLQPLPGPNINQLRQQLAMLFPESDAITINAQMLTVALAATQRFLVISGGPGTGKTTVVIKILSLLLSQQSDIRIKLAAPTGKAATRMMESIRKSIDDSTLSATNRDLIPTDASTIHRLLGYRGHRFESSRQNPLALDCLVIDEASMIDLPLMHRLLDAVPTDARVILLGDRDQLASVDAGNVLADITGHGHRIGYSESKVHLLAQLLDKPVSAFPSATARVTIADSIALLTHSYRFSAQSGIGRLADLINRGQADEVIQYLLAGDAQLNWHKPTQDRLDEATLNWVLSRYHAVTQSPTVSLSLAAFELTRVLCAVHAGPFGVDEINRQITAVMRSRQWIDEGENFRGKPVLITANDYELDLFNGDTGILWPDETGNLKAYFQSRDSTVRAIPIYDLPEHVCAWAMSVHKSQGSEFDSVLVVLPGNSNHKVVSRELLYTAVTRCRHHLLIYSNPEVLRNACQRLTKRHSGLAQKLGWRHL